MPKGYRFNVAILRSMMLLLQLLRYTGDERRGGVGGGSPDGFIGLAAAGTSRWLCGNVFKTKSHSQERQLRQASKRVLGVRRYAEPIVEESEDRQIQGGDGEDGVRTNKIVKRRQCT